MLESKTRKVPTLCRICLAHCGVLATITDGKLTKVEGDPDNLTEAVELWTFVRRPGGEWQVSAIQGAS